MLYRVKHLLFKKDNQCSIHAAAAHRHTNIELEVPINNIGVDVDKNNVTT